METQWLSVKVHPHAAKNVLVSVGPGRFEAWVKAKPMEGRANEAVTNLLARTLRIPPGRLRFVKGALTRHKVFKLIG